jgi:hypothetical protein
MQRFCCHATLLVLAVCGIAAPASGRGGLPADEPWNRQHVSGLPPEIRGALARMCGPSVSAQHHFALYSRDSRTITLHFEQLRCGERGALCTSAGCLHQVYERAGARYRLLKTFYAPGND